MKYLVVCTIFATGCFTLPQSYQPYTPRPQIVQGSNKEVNLPSGCRLEWQTFHSVEETEAENLNCSPYMRKQCQWIDKNECQTVRAKGATVFLKRGVTPSSKGFVQTFKERSTRLIPKTTAVMSMWGHARNTGGPTRMETRFGRRIRQPVKSYPVQNVNRWANSEINRSPTRSAKMYPRKGAISSKSKNATQFSKSFAKTYPERSAEVFLSKNARLFTPEFRKAKQCDIKWLHVTTSTTLT